MLKHSRGLALVGWCLIAAILPLVAWLSVAEANGSQVLAPAPLAVIIPAWWLTDWLDYYLAVDLSPELVMPILPGLAFVAFSLPVALGSSAIPRTSAWLFFIAAAGMALYILPGAYYGFRWQGPLYTLVLLLMNVAALTVLAWLLRWGRAQPSQLRSLAFHGTLFLWLAWCAFPSLGEMP